jgi:hypothetical protein
VGTITVERAYVIAPSELLERGARDKDSSPNFASRDLSSCYEVVKHAKADAECMRRFQPAD